MGHYNLTVTPKVFFFASQINIRTLPTVNLRFGLNGNPKLFHDFWCQPKSQLLQTEFSIILEIQHPKNIFKINKETDHDCGLLQSAN